MKLNVIKKIIFSFIVGFCISQAGGWTSLYAFSDNFDSYTTGSINSQGSWSSDGYAVVNTSESVSPPNSIQVSSTANYATHSTSYTGGDYSYSLRFKVNSGSNVAFRVNLTGGGGTMLPVVIENFSNVLSIKNGVSDTFYTSVSHDVWHSLAVNYLNSTSVYSVSLDGSPFIDSTFVNDFISGSNNIEFVRYANSGTNLFIDDFSDSNSLYNPPVTSTSTRIYHVAPLNGSTTSSSTFDIKYNYYVNSLTDSTLTKISIIVCPRSYSVTDCIVTSQNVTGFDSVYQNTLNITTATGKDGAYKVTVALWDGVDTTSCSWYQIGCTPKTAMYGPQDFWFFNVNHASGTNGTPDFIPEDTFYTPPSPSSCAIATLDLMPCFISTVKYLFLPDTVYLSSFYSSVWDKFSTRIPFNYIFALRDSISGLSSSTLPSLSWDISIGSRTLHFFDSDSFSDSSLASIIRSGFTILLWITFAFVVYRRVITIFDDRTVV